MKKTNILIERLLSKTPKFWKQVQATALAIGGSAIAVWVANGTLTLELPIMILSIIKYTLVACIAITGTAQLTKEDKP